MSKTNHQRGDKDNRFWLGQKRGPSYHIFSNSRKTMDGEWIGAGSTCTSESSRGVQRARAGAKKFVHSRTRFRDRMACHKLLRVDHTYHQDN